MSYILEPIDNGKKATVVGASGLYHVYLTQEDNEFRVQAGHPNADPLIIHKLAEHQADVAEELFGKICTMLGGGKSNVDLAKYARTEAPEPESDTATMAVEAKEKSAVTKEVGDVTE